jgi:hypothetical protein
LAPLEARASNALPQDGGAVDDDAAAQADVVDVDGAAPDGDTVKATGDEEGFDALADASDGSAVPDAAESDGGVAKADGAATEVDGDAATQASTTFGASADCAMGRLTSHRRRSPFSRIVVLFVAGAAVIRRKMRGA